MAGTGTTPPTAGLPATATGAAFAQYWTAGFRSLENEGITVYTFQDLINSLSTTFATWQELSAGRVRGVTFPLDFTDQLGQVPVDRRIIGMQAVARYGTDSATYRASPGLQRPPIYFELRLDSAGFVQALVNEKPETTARVQAQWYQVSGSDEEKIAQFEFLELEDHPYKAGDVRKFQFPNGAIRLVMWRADSVGYQHPVPTGLDSDPIYAPFALPAPAGVSQAQVDELQLQLDDVFGRLQGVEQEQYDATQYLATLNTKVANLAGSDRRAGIWDAQRNIVLGANYALAETTGAANNTAAANLRGRYFEVLATTTPFTTTATADTVANSVTIQVASTAGLGVGHTVTGPGVPAGTRVVQVLSSTAVFTNQANTVVTGAALLFTPSWNGYTKFYEKDLLYCDGFSYYLRPGLARLLATAASSAGTPAPPAGFAGFPAPRQLSWLWSYPGQELSGYDASNGTSVSRPNFDAPNNWPGVYASIQDPASYIQGPRVWAKRFEFYTSWDGPAYDQRWRIRIMDYATNTALVDRTVALDQTNRFYNYGGGWEWYRVGGGDGSIPSHVETLPAYADCYVIINYVSGGALIHGGIDIS